MIYMLAGYSGTDSVLKLIGLIALCVLILIASYYTTKFVGKSQMKRQSGSNFQVIDACRLTQNKMLQLVRAGNKYLVIGLSKDKITLITELSEEDIIPPTKQREDVKFKDILANVAGKKKKKDRVDTYETEEK